VYGYRAVASIIGVRVPYGAIGRQAVASLAMGVTVAIASLFVSLSIPVALALVAGGSVVYFAVLLGISTRFRTTVIENLQASGLR